MSQVDVWTPIGPEEVSGIGVGAGGVLGSIAIDGQTIYVGSGSCGVWRRYASSGSWNPVSDQLPTLGVAALAVDPARSGRVFRRSSAMGFISPMIPEQAGSFRVPRRWVSPSILTGPTCWSRTKSSI